MLKTKDSHLTFTINLTLPTTTISCYMVCRPINKTISILETKTQKPLYQPNQVTMVDKELLIEEFVKGKKIQLIIDGDIKAIAEIVGYGDEFTKGVFQTKSSGSNSVLLMVKPGFVQNKKLGEIFSVIERQFEIKRFKMFLLTKENLSKYIINQKMLNSQNNTKNIEYLTSGPCFGFEIIVTDNAMQKLRKIIGPQNPIEAKKTEALSLRAKYGTNIIQNSCHYSKTSKTAQLQLQFVFSTQVQELLPQLNNTCLCVIKPHITIEKKTGKILTFLLQKDIQINCMRYQTLKPELLEKYLDLYKFLPQHQQNSEHFAQGKCMFLEITIPNTINPVEEFKKFCGSYDPSYAKKISPDSLRGLFGIDRVKNAVHCTELSEDSESEIRLIFQL